MAQGTKKGFISVVITVEMCPIRFDKEKDYKAKLTKEIVITINALLNSGGGTLELLYKSNPVRKQIDDCIKCMEQKIENQMGSEHFLLLVEFEAVFQGIHIRVGKARRLFVLNYNMYFPTKSQVKAISPSASIASVVAMISKSNKTVEASLTPGYECDFVKGKQVKHDEDTNLQWKSLKSASSKCVTLADRITNPKNKLSCYVSAFGNCKGGHIYYGINDDGIVEGEEVTHQDKITIEVKKAIEKLVWPMSSGPRRGKEWEIFFLPVKDDSGKAITSTFIIVVAVAYCPGGVFTDFPEGYHIVDGKVEKMKVEDWKKYFPGPSQAISAKIPRLTWSSKKNKRVYQVYTTKLVQFRNDKKTKEFDTFCDLASKKYAATCATLVATAERAAIACKNNEFETIESLIDGFSKQLYTSDAKDVSFFEVRLLCMKSRVERAKKNFATSYEIAKDGLQQLQNIQPDFLSVWFYIHAAAVATILSTKETDHEKYLELIGESQTYLEEALKDLTTLDENEFPRSVADLKQKAHIYLAISHLGSSLTGEVDDRKVVTKVDIEKATSELMAVHGSRLTGIQPTQYQEVEYNLVYSDLCYRRGMLQTSSTKQKDNFKYAFELSKKAQILAESLQFDEAVHYASRRLARLTECLIRLAFQDISQKRSLENELDDLLNFE